MKQNRGLETNGDDHTGEKVTVSTRCKSCTQDFSQVTISKHISHSSLCKAEYTDKEIQVFKNWSQEMKEALGRAPRLYDSVKRRNRYLEEKGKGSR